MIVADRSSLLTLHTSFPCSWPRDRGLDEPFQRMACCDVLLCLTLLILHNHRQLPLLQLPAAGFGAFYTNIKPCHPLHSCVESLSLSARSTHLFKVDPAAKRDVTCSSNPDFPVSGQPLPICARGIVSSSEGCRQTAQQVPLGEPGAYLCKVGAVAFISLPSPSLTPHPSKIPSYTTIRADGAKTCPRIPNPSGPATASDHDSSLCCAFPLPIAQVGRGLLRRNAEPVGQGPRV